MSLLKNTNHNLLKAGVCFSATLAAFFPLASPIDAAAVVPLPAAARQDSLGVIRGFVRDEMGKPISNAVVAVFRYGTSKVFKEIRSGADGGFFAKILPGKYTILASAHGYFVDTVSEVHVDQAADFNYGFKLERAGGGNTLPEKKPDRKSSKWIIRAAQTQRSIYQAADGETAVDETQATKNHQDIEEDLDIAEDATIRKQQRGQSLVETYFASTEEGIFSGLNFATLQPVGKNSKYLIAVQTGTKSFAPQRFEAAFETALRENHRVRLSGAISKIGKINNAALGQISLQAFDEWQVRDGVIIVLGFDYSKFAGASTDSTIAPRFGLQVDVNAKTRLKSSLTTETEEYGWADAIDLEGSRAVFRNQFKPRTFAVDNKKVLMPKSSRLEFGIERILDNRSSIDAAAFFDSVTDRGVALDSIPFSALSGDVNEFTVTQAGKTSGVRIVYSRRINKIFSASAGYAFGRGQKIANQPDRSTNIFEDDLFQNFAGEINADFATGTSVKTIFRLSPQATVFAIDPFKGKLAIYDPGLSVIVTQALPTLGLPIRAEAVLDARNFFDYQAIFNSEDGGLRLNSQQRLLRGGISVRF